MKSKGPILASNMQHKSQCNIQYVNSKQTDRQTDRQAVIYSKLC